MNLLFSDTAFAQAAEQTAGQPSFVEMLIMPAVFLFIFYFLMIRPQGKKAREHRELLQNMKVGDEIVTSGGIIGRIKSISDGFVTIDSGSATFKVIKEHVSASTVVKASVKPAKQAAPQKAK